MREFKLRVKPGPEVSKGRRATGKVAWPLTDAALQSVSPGKTAEPGTRTQPSRPQSHLPPPRTPRTGIPLTLTSAPTCSR